MKPDAVPSGTNETVYERPLTRDQLVALHYIHANHGECSEGGLFVEGLNRPRHTLRSLERRGLVRRLFWENEETGYVYALARGGAA